MTRRWLVWGLALGPALGMMACGGDEGESEARGDAAVADGGGRADAAPDAGTAADAGGVDGAAADAAVGDAGAADGAAAPDATACDEPVEGPPAPERPDPGSLCAPCGDGGACPDGGMCLTNRNTGESFCGVPCVEGRCPRGAACAELEGGARQCVPAGGSCRAWPPSMQGAACAEDADCGADAPVCVVAGDVGYCSRACEADRDCPTAFARCRAGVCRADWEAGPQGCGRRSDGPLGAACGPCDACDGGLTCVSALSDAPLPETVRPFCTAACEGDEDCPEGAVCGALAGGVRVCLSEPCRCLAGAPGSLLDEALALAGHDRCTAIFRRETWALLSPAVMSDPFRLSFFHPVHDDPVRGLAWGRTLVRDLAERAGGGTPVADLIDLGAGLLDLPLPAERRGRADLDPDAPLVEAIRVAYEVRGRGGRFRAERVAAAVADVPAGLRRKIAGVLLAAVDVYEARRRMLSDADVSPPVQAALAEHPPTIMAIRSDFRGPAMTDPEIRRVLSGGMDLTPMLAAARDLAAAIEGADFAAEAGAAGFEVDLDTPLGRVVIRDAGDGVVPEGQPILLAVDTGGADRYEVPAGGTTGLHYPVSVLIDLGGDDVYGYPGSDGEPEIPGLPPADAAGRHDGRGVGQLGRVSFSTTARQGAGVLGVGLLFDLGGNDRYTSLKLSQGTGYLGVGALFDAAGDDVYACEQGCQGAAAYGIGLLVDAGGRDAYTGVQAVQGFGYVRGFGALHDAAGDDEYRALLGDPELGGVHLYPNAQNPGRSNTSLAQGAGFGRRADFSDGVFASGGVGILRDGAGNDRYVADVFGQGTGFWFGTGLLADAGGDDRYDGRWYVQGSGAHFASSYFFEGAGDDRYDQDVPILATAVGQGHDLSLGFLVDEGGNDVYRAPGLGLGAGNDNGIGFFLEGGGDDVYDAPDATTFGGAAIGDLGQARSEALCLGLFVDADGRDAYPAFEAEGVVGDGRIWTWDQRRPEHPPGAAGAGIDADGRSLALP